MASRAWWGEGGGGSRRLQRWRGLARPFLCRCRRLHAPPRKRRRLHSGPRPPCCSLWSRHGAHRPLRPCSRSASRPPSPLSPSPPLTRLSNSKKELIESGQRQQQLKRCGNRGLKPPSRDCHLQRLGIHRGTRRHGMSHRLCRCRRARGALDRGRGRVWVQAPAQVQVRVRVRVRAHPRPRAARQRPTVLIVRASPS